MARPAEPGRNALLDAGRRLLSDPDARPLARLSANAVVSEAAMSKGAFFQHFPQRRDYVIALHRQFHDRLTEVLLEQIAGLGPGMMRLRRGVECYLNFCQTQAGTKAFLFDARADGDLADEVAKRNEQFALLSAPDLESLGWSDPLGVARLLVASAAEVALIEAKRGRKDTAQRRALYALFRLA